MDDQPTVTVTKSEKWFLILWTAGWLAFFLFVPAFVDLSAFGMAADGAPGQGGW